MTDNNIEVTQPVPEKKNKKKKDKKKFFQRRSSWYLVGLLIGLLIILGGAGLGISRAINDRLALAETQAAPKIDSQLELARADFAEGRYEVAKTRLDWILDEMSAYLNAEEMAALNELYPQVLLMLDVSGAVALVTPTSSLPTVTPTPDVRGEEEMFNTAMALMEAESWDEAIANLEALREKTYPIGRLKWMACSILPCVTVAWIRSWWMAAWNRVFMIFPWLSSLLPSILLRKESGPGHGFTSQVPAIGKWIGPRFTAIWIRSDWPSRIFGTGPA